MERTDVNSQPAASLDLTGAVDESLDLVYIYTSDEQLAKPTNAEPWLVTLINGDNHANHKPEGYHAMTLLAGNETRHRIYGEVYVTIRPEAGSGKRRMVYTVDISKREYFNPVQNVFHLGIKRQHLSFIGYKAFQIWFSLEHAELTYRTRQAGAEMKLGYKSTDAGQSYWETWGPTDDPNHNPYTKTFLNQSKVSLIEAGCFTNTSLERKEWERKVRSVRQRVLSKSLGHGPATVVQQARTVWGGTAAGPSTTGAGNIPAPANGNVGDDLGGMDVD